MYILNGKVVVITGASSGIGKALAFEALKHGALVAVCARSMDKLNELYGGIDASQLFYMPTDVSKEEDCRKFMEAVYEKWGRIDVLLYCLYTSPWNWACTFVPDIRATTTITTRVNDFIL